MADNEGGGKRREEIMHNLFGYESGEEDDEIESDHQSNYPPQPASSEEGNEEDETEMDLSVDQLEVTSKMHDVAEEVAGSEKSKKFYVQSKKESENEDVNQATTPIPLETEDGYKTQIHHAFDVSDSDNNEMPTNRFTVYRETEEEMKNLNMKEQKGNVGPPLELEIPLQPPPAPPEEMHIIRISNIIGFDPRPFDPETYVPVDESQYNFRNIVRWRKVQNPDGTTTIESNSRFVHWDNGTIQLIIGTEALDITVEDMKLLESHLFIKHERGILQSQGRIGRKMRITPSSLSSRSHQDLVARVGSRTRKTHKVKRFYTDVDPERELQQKLKAESEASKGNTQLNRQKDKKKYLPAHLRRKQRQLSPSFLEDASVQEEEPNDKMPPISTPPVLNDDPAMDAQLTRRLINAKKDVPRKSLKAVAQSSSSEIIEGSKYGTDFEEEKDDHLNDVEQISYEYESPEEDAFEHPKLKNKAKDPKANQKLKSILSDDDSSKRKIKNYRRMAVIYESESE